MTLVVRVAATVLALALRAFAAEPIGYESLADWDSLPNSKVGVVAGLASSFDRAGGNSDFNQYESPAGLQTTDVQTLVTTLTGPGIVTRFWMPHAAADEGFTVRISVDGVVRIDTDSNAILGGAYAHMQGPLVQTLLGGQVSYEPIAFQNSLQIESNNFGNGLWARTHHYYQYSYHLLPPGQIVTRYNGSLTAAERAAREEVTSAIANVGANPGSVSATSVTVVHGSQLIASGGALTLASLTGSGRIRRLNLKMTGAADAQLDGLRLRVRYDGQMNDAIDVPVSHFFGAGHQRIPYRSLPLGTDSPDGFYSYWPMPYRSGAVVEVFNETASPIAIASAAVEFEDGAVPVGAGYLHAVFSEETTVLGQAHHQLLSVRGRGHYVGNLLYVQRSGISRNILEGDDVIVVDGVRTLFGTGMEDAYNGGYYYNHVLVQSDDGDVPSPEYGTGPYHGLLHLDDADFGDAFFRADQYRWLTGDYVPFNQSIDVRIENHGARADVLFGSTAYYYLANFGFGDGDRDGDVDLNDFAFLADCLSGPAIAPSPTPPVTADDCLNAFDAETDGDVDLEDIASFQNAISPGAP